MSDRLTALHVTRLGQLLIDRGWVLACAESCTGGLLSAAMTAIPGSSQWFDRGFVTYSNQAKIEQLGVNIDTLERFGAVSEETALEMATGALATSKFAQLAISTTGIAGPGGATPGKPVGMVCFGFSRRMDQGVSTRAMTKVFEGDRTQIRSAAVAFALSAALELIEPR